MLPHHSLSFSFTLIILFFSAISINVSATNTKLPKGFSIDLIHRDSPLSPFYNSSMTDSERVQNAVLPSISRANRFGQSSVAESVETDIRPNDGSYLMKISIGTPPVERWALSDTGSDLIWFQCKPCPQPQCYRKKAPLFDPKSSSTYMSLSCRSLPCKALPRRYVRGQKYPRCGSTNVCTYFYSYGDDSYTMGELATESVSFGRNVLFPKTAFGCGHNNNGIYNVNNAGLIGLAQGNLSLVSQMGKVGRKFSYCLPPYGLKTTTKLRFGEEATISGNGLVSTPLITKNGPTSLFYFLNLEGITVGQQNVRTGQRNGNIIIDSGTTLNMLPSRFYDQVEALVKQAIGADQFIVQNNEYKLCYRNANSIIQNIPNFEVHFMGANLSLQPQNFFGFISNDVACFTMLPTDGMPIYGNLAQIDFEVEHDLDQKKVSFAPVDCRVFMKPGCLLCPPKPAKKCPARPEKNGPKELLGIFGLGKLLGWAGHRARYTALPIWPYPQKCI